MSERKPGAGLSEPESGPAGDAPEDGTPERHEALLDLLKDAYGAQRRAREFLERFHLPHPDGDALAEELRRISLEDFYTYNFAGESPKAVRSVIEIYLELISRETTAAIKEKSIGYLFEYLQKILGDSGVRLDRNLPLVLRALDAIRVRAGEDASLMKKRTRDLKAILRFLIESGARDPVGNFPELCDRAFRASLTSWLAQPDPTSGFVDFRGQAEALAGYQDLVAPISHHRLRELLGRLEESSPTRAARSWGDLAYFLDFPDHGQIAAGYLRVADELERSIPDQGRRHSVRLDFLFKILTLPGLRDIHREILIEINRSLGRALAEKSASEAEEWINRVFPMLRESDARTFYPETVMNLIGTAAREIFKLNQHALADALIDQVILFGFQPPDVRGPTTDCEVEFNALHIKNIRAWLEIITLKPRWTKRLLSALIIHLELGGIFVRDTDLLQKDISALLNSDIVPAYNLVMQLAKLLPVFFHEINAEGELRHFSSRMDDISNRRDPLIHFLRKQSHVESNSTLVAFVEAVFRFWRSADREGLRRYLPEEVYERVEAAGDDYAGMHRIFAAVFRKHPDPRSLLAWEPARIEKTVQRIPDVPERDREKAVLVVRFYQLLYKKYHVQHQDVIQLLDASYGFDRPKLEALKNALARRHHDKSLQILLDLLSLLKARVLSPEKTEAAEDIYYKRHIAAGIPSMYGTYREPKVDALGLYLRLQSLTNVLFEQIINSLNLQFITKSTLIKVDKYFGLFLKALQLEGIAIEGLEAKVKYIRGALKIKRFSMDQYIDIFRFVSKGIQDVIRVYYIDSHRANLPVVLRQILARTPGDGGTRPGKEEEATYMMTENFVRSMIASAFGLQTLDNFISNILRTLCAEQEKFRPHRHMLNVLMSYNPEIAMAPLYRKPHRRDDQILLGNKGYFLKQLHSFGFPIPPGFVITTEVFRCLDAVLGYEEIANDLNRRLDRELAKLEVITRKKYGDPRNPLLLSVRSGAAIALPGMMGSFLNVGMNEKIAEALGGQGPYAWAAWDSYRRFLQFWGMSEGLNRDFFDEIIDRFKEEYRISKKLYFKPDQMRTIALAYKRELEKNGIAVEDEPREQLRKAVFKVIESWHSPRAELYRHEMNISDNWGTAVIVQAMVFGNLNERSGSGVTFTRDPKGLSSAVLLYGDFIFGAQGDDIVTGLVETYPVSETQRKTEKRDCEISLENTFPAAYAELKRLAESLIYEKGFDHQEIEFTFEDESEKGLFILQTRDMPPPERVKIRPFAKTDKLQNALIGYGIGIGGGAMSGRAVFSEAEIKRFGSSEPNTPLILIRPDTVPDDIGLLRQVEGVLTAKGGSTSHAAVIIPQLQKVGVVGLRSLKVYEKSAFGIVNGRKIKSGDFLGIDGWSGSVYLGKHRVESEETYPVKI